MSAELSGRVSSLEDKVSFIVSDLLRKVDLVTSSSSSTLWEQSLDTMEQTIYNMQSQMQTLQNLYTNLYITHRNHYIEFTGHTGNSDIHV